MSSKEKCTKGHQMYSVYADSDYEDLICPKCKDPIGKIETVWRCKEVGCCGETYHD